ncbi:MAG: tellurium resistance protein TerC [Planctomycetaceae bacterium]|nr:tellurium resistance protein TerC [Planctomycetaceae bacterium]MBP60618.1 tellurium resistance protein TerC [Planctomycetaceae bacterium]
MLILLQAVLGFDNLLYISIESKRVEAGKQAAVRRLGIAVAIVLRLVLLFILMTSIKYLQTSFCSIDWRGWIEGAFNVHSLIVLGGGVFIVYTALKEIIHLLGVEELEGHGDQGKKSFGGALFWIITMNLIFSFDSILSALALTDLFVLMVIAVVVSGGLMIWLADHVAEFLKKNRMMEVLGLFILLIVGIMLLSEGAHLAHLRLFGHVVEPMAKSTFYFVIAVLVLIDIVQARYQKKLLARRNVNSSG